MFLSGKYSISCIWRSDIRILVLKGSFRLWTNQFLIISKLFLWSAEFFCLFFMKWLGNNVFDIHFFLFFLIWEFFLNIFDVVWYIIKWRIGQNFYICSNLSRLMKQMACWIMVCCWRWLYSMHFHVCRAPEVLFYYCFGSNITLLMLID